jgi:thioredoxin reductase (NADPH)
VVWDSVVEEILGASDPPGVTGVRLRSVKTGEARVLAADGVFIAIGHVPSTELFAGQIEMKRGNYLVTRPDSTATSIPGVFAAGDVTDDIYRQAVTAAGLGCMAALEAEKFLATAEQPAERAVEAAE